LSSDNEYAGIRQRSAQRRGRTELYIAIAALFFFGAAGLKLTATPVSAGEPPARVANAEAATFAGGCFWCVEAALEKVPGVLEVVSGYTGGTEENPTYSQVASGRSSHREAVRVRYDPARLSYDELLVAFWRSIDPTDNGGQFADRGTQYRTAIFFHNVEQHRAAERSRRALAASGLFDRPIAVKILQAGAFYEAEAYHQDYYKKNPDKYLRYFRGSGRAAFIERVWEPAQWPQAGS